MTEREKNEKAFTRLIMNADETKTLSIYCMLLSAIAADESRRKEVTANVDKLRREYSKGSFKRVIKGLRECAFYLRRDGKDEAIKATEETIEFIRHELLMKKAV